jgi:hypothetical protein
MKTILSFLFILSFLDANSQDNSKIKQIDSIVVALNASTLPVQRDTLIKDYPQVGLKMVTYLSMIMDGKQLRKYVNYVRTTRIENGTESQMTSSSTFYYEHNNLVKVEEYLIDGDAKKNADWYYSDDKPLHYNLKSDNAAERALSLLAISKTMLKQIIK